MQVRSTEPGGRGYWPVDLLTAAYLAVTGLLILVSPLGMGTKASFVYAHFALLAAVLLLGLLPRERPALWSFVRAVYPLAGLYVFYQGVQVLNRLTTARYYDPIVLRWEEQLFACQPSQIFCRSVPWWPLSEFLHFAYAFYLLLIPIAVVGFLLTRQRAALRLFTTSVMGTFFICYLAFVFFPVRGPFQHLGPIAPASKGFLFPQIVHALLTGSSSVGTAFPSSHVAVAVAIAIAAWPYLPRLRGLFVVAAAGIFFGTVYGGYHYAVDSLAGLIVGGGCGMLMPRLHRRLAVWLGVAG